MRARFQLLLVALVPFILLLTTQGKAGDPEIPAGTSPAHFFEDGFEVFVGCGDGRIPE